MLRISTAHDSPWGSVQAPVGEWMYELGLHEVWGENIPFMTT